MTESAEIFRIVHFQFWGYKDDKIEVGRRP
jgi:hypothetical protein